MLCTSVMYTSEPTQPSMPWGVVKKIGVQLTSLICISKSKTRYISLKLFIEINFWPYFTGFASPCLNRSPTIGMWTTPCILATSIGWPCPTAPRWPFCAWGIPPKKTRVFWWGNFHWGIRRHRPTRPANVMFAVVSLWWSAISRTNQHHSTKKRLVHHSNGSFKLWHCDVFLLICLFISLIYVIIDFIYLSLFI